MMRKIPEPIKTLTMMLGFLLVGYGTVVTSVWSGERNMPLEHAREAFSKTNETAAPATRIIYGTVEGLTDTHIKVESGEVGEITPRYLEVEKFEGNADDLKVGDRLKMVVGNQNLVQDFSKVEEQ